MRCAQAAALRAQAQQTTTSTAREAIQDNHCIPAPRVGPAAAVFPPFPAVPPPSTDIFKSPTPEIWSVTMAMEVPLLPRMGHSPAVVWDWVGRVPPSVSAGQLAALYESVRIHFRVPAESVLTVIASHTEALRGYAPAEPGKW
jgi:hypothetical protein